MLTETLENKWSFLSTFVLIFFISFVSFTALGFAPFRVEGASESASIAAPAPAGAELPTRVVIDSIGVDASIANPTSADSAVLDTALQQGAVRYPGSVQLNESGTVYLFAHSSYLKIVHNSAYKTFNGIQKLNPGDTITVSSATTDYRYHVISVQLVDAESALVDLTNTGTQKLVLSTCDSFGTKSQRFVVEADFVGSSPIAK